MAAVSVLLYSYHSGVCFPFSVSTAISVYDQSESADGPVLCQLSPAVDTQVI